MDEYGNPVSRPTPVLLFAVVAVVLVAILLAGIFFGKRYVASLQPSHKVATTSANQPDTKKATDDKSSSANDKKIADQKAADKKQAEQQAAHKKQAEQKKQAETEAKTKAEQEKKQQEIARQNAPAANTQTPPSSANSANPSSSSQSATQTSSTSSTPGATSGSSVAAPGSVAATGPEETLPFLVATAALGYCGYRFIESKRRTSTLRRSLLQ